MDDTNGQLTSADKLGNLLEEIFPSENLTHAFGYGSGVFSQGRNPGMLDMIFIVEDAQAWHQANQAKNSLHYASWLRTMDQNGICAAGVQRSFLRGRDGKVFFHVIEDPIPLKYGVIQKHDYLEDLTLWKSLYIAGRLHKPTLTIPLKAPVSEELLQAQHSNLQAAVAAAMLLSPTSEPSLSWLDFYSRIASLSYTGDFRMKVGGEDPEKIQKLVQTPGQLDRFHYMYRGGDSNVSTLRELESTGLLSMGDGGLQWDPLDISSRTQLIKKLPQSLKKPLLVPSTTTSRQGSSNPVENHLIQQQETLAQTLESIVAPAARYQSLKGVLTLGLRKSVRYAGAKLSKGLLRKL